MNKAEYNDILDALNIYMIDPNSGYTIGKDGSCTIGLHTTLPHMNNLTGSDFFCDDNNREGLNLFTKLKSAISIFTDTENCIIHQQDVIYYDTPNINNDYGDYLFLSEKIAFNKHKFLNSQTYFFITLIGNGVINNETYVNKARLEKFIDNVASFSIALPFEIQRMTADDWINYLSRFFSLNFSEKYTKAPLLDFDLANKKIGDFEVKGYASFGDPSFAEMPKARLFNNNRSTSEGLMFNSFVYPILFEVPCYKIVNNIIKICNTDQLKDSLRSSALWTNLLKIDKKTSDGLIFKRHSPNEEFIELIDTNYCTPVLHHFNTFFIYEKENRDAIKTATLSAFEKLKFRESEISINFDFLFFSSIGGCASRLEFPYHFAPSFLKEAICLSNLEGNYNQKQKGIILGDTNGSPVFVDFDKKPFVDGIISNYNAITIGISGAGKSVYQNKRVLYNNLMGYFTFIIDIGDSYLPLSQYLGESAIYIKLDDDISTLSGNPFWIPLSNPNNEFESNFLEEDIEVFVELILFAWDATNTLGTHNANTISSLKKLLRAFYMWRYENNVDYINFTTIYNFICGNHENIVLEKFFDIDSFKLILENFTENHSYGFMWNGKTNLLNLSDKINTVIFEMEKIGERPLMYNIMMLTIIISAKRAINLCKHSQSRLLIDEGWRFLEDERFGSFIKSLYKTSRKKGAGVEIIVQELDNITSSPHASALLANSGTITIYPHEGKEHLIKDNKSLLSLTDNMLTKVLSLKLKNREIFVMQGNKCDIYKVILSPEELFLFGTQKEEKARRQSYLQRASGNMKLAIKQFIEDTQKTEEH